MLRKLLFIGLVLLGGLSLAVAMAYAWLVVFAPGSQIRQGNIDKILAVESPVYYKDGLSKIGVFFQDSHRQYTPFNRIPESFVMAIVAAEDNNFFSHYGIDFKGLTRAVIANLRAGRVVQGGSTITQQTAKNLFKRQSRSMIEKFKEMLFALRLEYHYPKEKILEFYVNQFFVSGNGRGLGVAARYYFNKPVEELDLLECAFVAGSVKKPNAYNPFIKKDEEAAVGARDKARLRTAYVLGQMKKLGMITAREYDAQRQREIPFQQGRTYFSLNTVMDLVKEAMVEPTVQGAFLHHGIENIATSGIRIFTTVEKDLQEAALLSLRKELSRLDTQLRGYERGAVQQALADLKFGNKNNLHIDGFLVGRVMAVKREAEAEVQVTFEKHDPDGAARGIIDKAGLWQLLAPLVRFERHRWSEPGKGDMAILLDRLQVGDLVYVSVRGRNEENGRYLLNLEKYPLLQGAVLAFRQGRIQAMVGGMENRFFNRAVYARRPMGSVIKPLVYCAAMQLGWNSIDLLNNERNVFVYQNSFYFPRPDHQSPHKQVTMNWAGVKSENLATIWLLYHLCDHLSVGNFKEVVAQLGLSRQPSESYSRYKRRIRDEYGILVNREALLAAAYNRAVMELEPDFVFSGRIEEYDNLRTISYGAGFQRYSAQNFSEQDKESSAGKDKETRTREGVLQRNFLRFQEMRNELELLRRQLITSSSIPAVNRIYRFGKSGRVAFFVDPPKEQGWRSMSAKKIVKQAVEVGPSFWDNIFFDGLLSNYTVGLLAETLQKEYEKLAALPPYSAEILQVVPDFRVLVSLQYLIGLCRNLGIESPLDPVLSFPLGSNVITLLEVVKAYEGMLGDGTYEPAEPDEVGVAAIIIDRIEDSEGNILYKPILRRREAVDQWVKVMVGDIMRNVVKFGTGSKANSEIRLHSDNADRERQLSGLNLRVPVLGKTGTANRFTNAVFAGVVPGLTEDGQSFAVENGYVVASYVGFDDNNPMVKGSIKISGSSGALPVWNRFANAILRAKKSADQLDLVDFSFSNLSQVPLRYKSLGQIEVEIDSAHGGRHVSGNFFTGHDEGLLKDFATDKWFFSGTRKKSTMLTFGVVTPEMAFEPKRRFRPYWHVVKGE